MSPSASLPVPTVTPPPVPTSPNPCEISERDLAIGGLVAAFGILGTWALSLAFLMRADITQWSFAQKLCGLAWQTFLYTGLFVTAHDGMHGSICVTNARLNDAIGAIAIAIYALFDFKTLRKRHHEHHARPSTELDPDYHDGRRTNFFQWYSYFMTRYWSWLRLFSLIAIFHIVHRLFGVPEANLAWFWVYPSVLSSAQLFFFGTYLPHRETERGYANVHRTQSTEIAEIWSFLTCYHFGYHYEHHEYPGVPWWQLPMVYRKTRET
ncbi:MAG: fatty acid desaturase [Geitlerinemataceae cyanobacterium]